MSIEKRLRLKKTKVQKPHRPRISPFFRGGGVSFPVHFSRKNVIRNAVYPILSIVFSCEYPLCAQTKSFTTGILTEYHLVIFHRKAYRPRPKLT